MPANKVLSYAAISPIQDTDFSGCGFNMTQHADAHLLSPRKFNAQKNHPPVWLIYW